jgi:hypothetical protein
LILLSNWSNESGQIQAKNPFGKMRENAGKYSKNVIKYSENAGKYSKNASKFVHKKCIKG